MIGSANLAVYGLGHDTGRAMARGPGRAVASGSSGRAGPVFWSGATGRAGPGHCAWQLGPVRAQLYTIYDG